MYQYSAEIKQIDHKNIDVMRNVVLMIAVYVAYHSAVCCISCDTHYARTHMMFTDHGKRTMKDFVCLMHEYLHYIKHAL